MAVEKLCPVNLCIQLISSGAGADEKYVRLIGVNRREQSMRVHSGGERSMSG